MPARLQRWVAACALVVLLGASRSAAANVSFAMQIRFTDLASSPALEKAMASEAASIWAPYGVHLVWASDSMSNGASEAVDGSFAVVVEHAPRSARSERRVLGSTQVQLGVIEHRPIRIDYAATERMLGTIGNEQLVAFAGQPVVDARVIGRALGRVLAHEIGHVLLALPQHQPRGLMRAVYLPEDLVSRGQEGLTLSPGEIERLRSRERLLCARTSALAP